MLYCGVAHDKNLGEIPGKVRGNECLYVYGGRELTTSSFSWVAGKKSVAATYSPGNSA
eukprot:NODE_4438_length_662_cov_29.802610_g3790_i0.p3 GENE.NODE_4438_length_662_cov_29.802610_g3790_i0~~NODE_4438_length_662_cov_29.802610_g3790_i0.p3  ORF type:complete len:58 (+),score=9.76 NODE_4438_length_662_cov_29.802610_g3790_i0:357-530(+)